MSTAVVPFRQDQKPEAEAPPHNAEVEQALLGALMVWPGALEKLPTDMSAEHFFFADHQEIFSVIQRLAAAGAQPTAPAVKGYLPKAEIGGQPAMSYLAHLGTNAGVGVSVPGYAAIVMDFAQRRRLAAIGEELTLRARHDPIDESGMLAASLIEDVEAELLAARRPEQDDEATSFDAGAGADWMLDRIEQIQAGNIKGSSVPSGIADLDRATNGGFQRGQLWLLAARPGMGKTVAMTSLSRFAARHDGAMVFQLEVTKDQQIARYLADLSYIHNRPMTFGQIMAGKVDEDEKWRLQDARKRLGRLNLKVDCRDGITVAQIVLAVKAEKKRMAARGVSLGTVFIDYLKFIKVSDRYKGQRVLEIGEITGSLKQLAKREDICVVLLTQLSRQTENQQRESKRPTLADLRDSGELEQDADTVLFLYREAYYLKGKLDAAKDAESKAKLSDQLFEQQHDLEVILGKNRSGPTTTLNLWCDVSASSIAQSARGPQ